MSGIGIGIGIGSRADRSAGMDTDTGAGAGGGVGAEGNAIRVSVIVPCRNEEGHIGRFLREALGQEPPRGTGREEIEFLVADGGSTDGTRGELEEAARRDDRLRVIENPEGTVSPGLNRAIRAARGEIVLRMDVHTEYAPDYLRRCVETLERTGAANVGGPARTRAEGYWPRAIAAAYHSAFCVGGARFHNPEYEGPLDTVVYGCWRKSTLIEAGLFDEELGRNQDDELNFRIALGGGTLWQDPKIRSWYRPRGSLRALFRQYFQYGYWKVRVMRKHGRPAAVRHLVPGAFALFAGAGWAPGLVALFWSRVLPEGFSERAARAGWAGLWLWAGVLGLYGAASLAAAAAAARKPSPIGGWDLFPALPLVFLTYHAGYGLGFLLGVWDFQIMNRDSGRAEMSALTRGGRNGAGKGEGMENENAREGRRGAES